MTRTINQLFYIDDSGEPKTGMAVYGWIEISPASWAATISHWRSLRKMLWREFGVPMHKELHASEFVNGRGRISKKIPDRHCHDGQAYWKDFGREVAEICLDHVRSCEGLRVGSAFLSGNPSELTANKQRIYLFMLEQFQRDLKSADHLGMVFIDGDGSDISFVNAHRELDMKNRVIIEDAIHLDSKHSYLVQIADLVAWTALASLERTEWNKYAWHWYEKYLAERDPSRNPQPA